MVEQGGKRVGEHVDAVDAWFRGGGFSRCAELLAPQVGEAAFSSLQSDVWDGLRRFFGVLRTFNSTTQEEVDKSFYELVGCASVVGRFDGCSSFDRKNTVGGVRGDGVECVCGGFDEHTSVCQGGVPKLQAADVGVVLGVVEGRIADRSGGEEAQVREDGASDEGLAARFSELPTGGVKLRGKNYNRNQRSRLARSVREQRRKDEALGEEEGKKKEKEKKKESFGFFSKCDEELQVKLRSSRAARLVAENERAERRAIRDVAVADAVDLDLEIRRQRTSVSAALERNMVSIEKTHAALAATGNVPGDMTGFAATINGSISPDSSASNQEYRACQKALADAEYKLKKVQEMTGVDVDAIVVSPEHQFKEHHLLDIFTDNSTNKRYIDENYGDYIIESASNFGFAGKNRIRAF